MILSLALGFWLLAVGLAVADTPKVGLPAPKLELPNLKGETVSLSSLQGEKIVILTFWTTWSKTCSDELIFLQKLYNKYEGKNLEILAVSFDSKTTNLQSFINKNNITFPVLTDKKHRYLDKYCILIIPTTFLIDKSGILQNIYVDFDAVIRKNLEKDLAELLVP